MSWLATRTSIVLSDFNIYNIYTQVSIHGPNTLTLKNKISCSPIRRYSTFNTPYQNLETPLISPHRVRLKNLIVLANQCVPRFKQTRITCHTSYSKQVFTFGTAASSPTPWSFICCNTHRWTVLRKPDCRDPVTYTGRGEALGRWIRRDFRAQGNHCCSWPQTSRQSSVKKISVTLWRFQISSFPQTL